MKRCMILFLIFSMFLWTGFAGAQNLEKKEAALSAAKDWLSIIDSGNYEQSWQESAKYFQNAVTEKLWLQSLNDVREPLGNVETRQVKSMHYTTSLPNAPDGEYVVIQFDTSFKNLKSAIETITPMIEKDGRWRVSGYYIIK